MIPRWILMSFGGYESARRDLLNPPKRSKIHSWSTKLSPWLLVLISKRKKSQVVGFSTLFALQNNIVKLWRETLEATALTVAFENAVLENPAFLRLNHPQNRVLSCCWRPLWCQQSSLLSNVETFSQAGQEVAVHRQSRGWTVQSGHPRGSPNGTPHVIESTENKGPMVEDLAPLRPSPPRDLCRSPPSLATGCRLSVTAFQTSFRGNQRF